MYCHNCGEQIAEGGTFCHKCGSQKFDASAGQSVSEAPIQPQAGAQATTAEIKYAGFWIRFVASMIDGLILSVAIFSLVLIPIVGWILIPFVSFIYFAFMTDKYQDTLGKRLFGLMVVSENFEKLTFKKVLMREVVGKIVSSVTFNIGYLIAAFTKRKQALHDFIGDSVVIYRKK
ncbi:MAG TPA: hypothetical protein DCX32_04470 [Candidatus Moranbacteria bacterium]|nr:MAG: hypothetical protein UW87_C0002G0031 [Candidatus Moranbacteria bacterium GW2011_GWC2_45_10]KKT95201.1 MAG: hypothetical protein UW95_C0003G0043 [Parcubacteria group bacterium GW2011_GWC1_45_14]HAV11762.1 hypothetical protein [Candidatus Moranbacteria bacterium]